MADSALLAWAGPVGAWLLFAGPVYQASVELRTQAALRAGVADAVRTVDAAARVSAWWWLLPPVAVVLQRRRTREFQAAVFDILSPAQIAEWVRLTEKATGWWLVAAGAFLIAVHETGGLLGELDAAPWAVWPVVAVCGSLGVLFTVARQHTTERIGQTAGLDFGSR